MTQLQQKLKLRDLPSGQALRNYRRKLAAYARSKDPMLTTKFKLEMPPASNLDFDACRQLYDAVEGCGKGSLTYFLFSVVLSGFRLFASSTEVEVAASKKNLDEAGFRTALMKAASAELPNFTVGKLIKQLGTAPRSRGGKDIQFTREVIAREYRKSLCNAVPKGADEAFVASLFDGVAAQIQAAFDSWNAVVRDRAGACAAVDRALEAFGVFPSLKEMVLKSSAALPDKSTILWVEGLPFVSMESVAGAEPYAVVAMILGYADCPDEDKAAFVQRHLTTNKASGLSWLFNKGLELFKTQDVETLCRLYHVPANERRRIEQIKAAAQAVPEQRSFYRGAKPFGYHDFRSSFAGRTNSWTKNYCKRLEELLSIAEAEDLQIRVPNLVRNGRDFLDVADCRREEISALCRAFEQCRPAALSALKHLLGGNPQSASADVAAVKEYGRLVDRLAAIRNQLNNALNQAKGERQSPWQDFLADFASELAPWNKLSAFPKLNAMSGGVPDVEAELLAARQQFRGVLDAQRSHFAALMSWARRSGIQVDVVGAAAQKTAARLKGRKAQSDPLELALRQTLQRIGRLVRDRSDPCAEAVRGWFKIERIFASEKDFNKFFCNRQGSLYVSPFSARRHEPYALRSGLLDDRLRLWESFTAFVRDQRNAFPPQSSGGETFLRLEGLYIGMVVAAIPCPIPQEEAALRLSQAQQDDVLPEGLKLQLRQPHIEPSALSKAFNAYMSLLSGSLILLRRERFYLRTKFLWVANNKLLYVPKNREWHLPQSRYANSETWRKIFESGVIQYAKSGAVDVLRTFESACARLKMKRDAPELRMLLEQLPHDWCYEVPIRLEKTDRRNPSQDELDVIKVVKKGEASTLLSPGRVRRSAVARLIGPCSHKSRLDQLIRSPANTAGDMTLLADQAMSCSFSDEAVPLRSETLQFSLAVPIAPEPVQASAVSPFKRIVSIDQGETGFSFAVFDLKDAGAERPIPIAAGSVRIPSIRRLIKSVRRYRKGKQSTQKFNQRFDSTMFTLRENVAGDVCGAIAGLMARYHAFPILERQVGNLESGSKQLELVYKMVNTRFLIDGTPAHQSERSSWWYGAQTWTLESLLEEVSDDYAADTAKRRTLVERAGKRYRPLLIGPGAAVNAKWTSRICSCCGGNVAELIERAKAAGMTEIPIDGNGEVTLFGRTVRLYGPPNAEAKKKARRRNERADWNAPLTPQTLKIDQFFKLAKANMRRPPKSLQSKDTSQSRYYCVFSDCPRHAQEQHADVNAAVNIGRRFLTRIRLRDA